LTAQRSNERPEGGKWETDEGRAMGPGGSGVSKGYGRNVRRETY